MGSSTTRNPRTGREVFDCWQCGHAGGVRRHRCPAGWCPPTQLCRACKSEAVADGRWKAAHVDCRASSDDYTAREAAKDASPHDYPRSAWGRWHTATNDVLVLTRAGTWVLVPHDDYEAGGCLPDSIRPWTPGSGVTLPVT
jgi:hypothetical protein